MAMLIRSAFMGCVMAALSACGGGTSVQEPASPNPGIPNPPPVVKSSLALSGTAATGLALVDASIQAKCQVGSAQARTGPDGAYQMEIVEGKFPCLLQLTAPVNGIKLHSVVVGAGSSATANITPLTDMLSSRLFGRDLSALFPDIDAASLVNTVNAANVLAAQSDIVNLLQAKLSISFLQDFIGTPLKAATAADKAGGDAHDRLLDRLGSYFNSIQLGLINQALVSGQTVDDIKKLIVELKAVPVADAGKPQAVATGATVSLDASASQIAPGVTANFRWSIIGKPATSVAELSLANTAKPTFVADKPGSYMFSVLVDYPGERYVSTAIVEVTAQLDAPYQTTPAVSGAPNGGMYGDYWKLEFTGANAGFCDVLFVSPSGSSYTPGMCISNGKLLGDFALRGDVEKTGNVTLNMRVNPHIPESTQTAAIFRGVFGQDGTGAGTWSIPNSAANGAWTATRYIGRQPYRSVTLANPDAGSFASGTNAAAGVWRRPSTKIYPEFALVLPGGETAWQTGSPFSSGMVHVFGEFLSDGAIWQLGNKSTVHTSTSIEGIQASGTIVPKTCIVGTMSAAAGKTVTLSFDSYSIENALALSLADISGTYVAGGASYIAPDGSISGTTEAGCRVQGRIAPISPDSKANLFRLKLTFYGPASNPAACYETQMGPDYDGYAFMEVSEGEHYFYTLLRPSGVPVGYTTPVGFYPRYILGMKIR
ncbi:PKD domain-containing protein [Janthinobacterium sp. PLB04]|uniref:Uncharacterized protein n=1 Tax=Janthinobacterium lividum TaxID=29581 RepID=A0AAJ4MRN1_9BURK|nr:MULTISPECIES: hypothetical protein [Janthinobacterium]KAB0326549.1 hypothetical protein F3B38_23805 [Janthinobacterium lividum]QSX95681.1 hypothetical protein J3P46_23995 [Janthinobacterium lividum]UGQ35529.1 PKD domain-containing protein [Janthinobacterium sp. PLB04]